MNEEIKFFIKNILDFDLDNDFIFIKDNNLNYVYANEKFCDFFKVSLKNLKGMNDQYLMIDNLSLKKCKESDLFTLNNNFFISDEIVFDQKYRVLKLKINLENHKPGILCLAKVK